MRKKKKHATKWRMMNNWVMAVVRAGDDDVNDGGEKKEGEREEGGS